MLILVYISDKFLNLSTIDKIHFKCVVIAGSTVNGIQSSLLLSFVLDKPAGYKVFCEPETIQYKKITKSVANTKSFYLEDDDRKEVDFNG